LLGNVIVEDYKQLLEVYKKISIFDRLNDIFKNLYLTYFLILKK